VGHKNPPESSCKSGKASEKLGADTNPCNPAENSINLYKAEKSFKK
jgi:hypothetical protein